MADQALAAEEAGGLAEGVPGDAEFGGERGLAQRRARRDLPGQDDVPERGGGLLGGGLPLDGRAEAIATELTRRGVIVSPRVGSTRFSLHFYNSGDDVARALAVLDEVLRGTVMRA